MKNWKKALAGILALCLMLATAGCAPADPTPSTTPATQVSTAAPVETTAAPTEPKDPVVLEWYYRGNGQQKDTEEVEAAVNELLKEYPGLEHVSININCFPSSDYKQQIVLAQSSGAQMDLISSVSLDFYEQIDNGTWMPLDDYLTDTLKAELPDWLWEMGSVDGKIMIVPNYQNAFNASFIAIPKEYLDKYGDYEKIKACLQDETKTLAERVACLEEFAVAVREGEGNTKYLNTLEPNFRNVQGTLGMPFITPHDNLTGGFIVTDGTTEVSYAYEEAFWKESYAIYADWFDKGIYSPDGINSKANYGFGKLERESITNVFEYIDGYGTEEDAAAKGSASKAVEVVAIKVQPYDFIQKNWAAGGTGISSTCEHPEEAALLLEALNCGSEIGKKIYNTMVFGIEGKHYNFVDKENERIETVEYEGSQGGVDTSYAGLKWILGNSFYAYKNQAVTDTQYPLAKVENEAPDTVASSLIGFAPDLTGIQTKLDQIAAIEKEYLATLQTGVMGADGWEATYNEFIDKIKVAGMEDVKAELQRQLDAFLASK